MFTLSTGPTFILNKALERIMMVFLTVGRIVSIEETIVARFIFEICDAMEFKCMVNGLKEKHNNCRSKWECYNKTTAKSMPVRIRH